MPTDRAHLRVVPQDAGDATTHKRRVDLLAGPLTGPPAGDYRVQYLRLAKKAKHHYRSVAFVVADMFFTLLYGFYLFQPGHFPALPHGGLRYLDLALVAAVVVINVFMLINVAVVCRATILARDPIPVTHEPGKKVAFITTFVPSTEDVTTLENTLTAMKRVRYDGGSVDIHVLDEGTDNRAAAGRLVLFCYKHGIARFSRRGVPAFNVTGDQRDMFAAKTKHGNINAWFVTEGLKYDFIAGVDNDHQPVPSYLERMAGFMRDPDVAFVVGPQVYGNYADGFIPKAAESMQFLFHGWLQRAANRWDCAMFVGTNYLVRVSALESVGGLRGSITEDMATSLMIHSARNPETGNRWKSVYTPDVLATGEGPTTWKAFFNQQMRWSRGTDDALLLDFWRTFWRLRPGQILHYASMMSFYPTVAISYLLGALSAVLYLVFGATGMHVNPHIWLMLFVNAAVMQVGLYFFNRRHNVSPHEPEGSTGVIGMAMAVLSTPIFVVSLVAAVLGREPRFIVTPKGDRQEKDVLRVFTWHLLWATLLGSLLLISAFNGHDQPQYRFWVEVSFGLCFVPLLICYYARLARFARQRLADGRHEVRERLVVVQADDRKVRGA